jgi:hypothetical protein
MLTAKFYPLLDLHHQTQLDPNMSTIAPIIQPPMLAHQCSRAICLTFNVEFSFVHDKNRSQRTIMQASFIIVVWPNTLAEKAEYRNTASSSRSTMSLCLGQGLLSYPVTFRLCWVALTAGPMALSFFVSGSVGKAIIAYQFITYWQLCDDRILSCIYLRLEEGPDFVGTLLTRTSY